MPAPAPPDGHRPAGSATFLGAGAAGEAIVIVQLWKAGSATVPSAPRLRSASRSPSGRRSNTSPVAARATTSVRVTGEEPPFSTQETIGPLARSWEIVVVPGAAGMTGVPLPRMRTNVVLAPQSSPTVATKPSPPRASSCGCAA